MFSNSKLFILLLSFSAASFVAASPTPDPLPIDAGDAAIISSNKDIGCTGCGTGKGSVQAATNSAPFTRSQGISVTSISVACIIAALV